MNPQTTQPNGMLPEDSDTAPFSMDVTKAGEYIAYETVSVLDLNDHNAPPIPLKKGTKVYIAGTFMEGKYGRPQFAVRQNSWYGVDMGVFVDKHKTVYDRFVIALGAVVGVLNRKKVPNGAL